MLLLPPPFASYFRFQQQQHQQAVLIWSLVISLFLTHNNNHKNGIGIFVQGQGLDDFLAQYNGPCVLRENDLQQCIDRWLPPVREDWAQTFDASSAFASEASANVIEGRCEDEIEEYEDCLVDNDITDGLSQCRYHVRLWNACMIGWNLVLVCLDCNGTAFEDTCDEFEVNTCDRWKCCEQCEYYLKDYIECVQESNQCDAEEYFDCEVNQTTSWGFWGRLFFGLLMVCLVALVSVLIVCCIMKKRTKKEEQVEDDEPQDTAVAQPQRTIVATNNPTTTTTPAAADSIPEVDDNGGDDNNNNDTNENDDNNNDDINDNDDDNDDDNNDNNNNSNNSDDDNDDAPPTTTTTTTTSSIRVVTGQAARMNELNQMATDGTITQEEFEQKKNEILASL